MTPVFLGTIIVDSKWAKLCLSVFDYIKRLRNELKNGVKLNFYSEKFGSKEKKCEVCTIKIEQT